MSKGNIILDGNLSQTYFDVNAQKGVFTNCGTLKSVNIPSECLSLGPFMFDKCSNLEEVVLPQNVQQIRDYCFRECSNLKTLKLHEDNHIVAIYPGAFMYDDKFDIDTLNFKYLQYLGAVAFFGTQGIKHIKIGPKFKYYGRTSGPIPETETQPNEAMGHIIPNWALTIDVDEANASFKTVDSLHLLSKDGTIYYDGVLGGICQNRIMKIPEGVTTLYFGALREPMSLHQTVPDYTNSVIEELVLPSTLTKIQNRALQYYDVPRLVCLAPTPPEKDWSFLGEGSTYNWTIDIYVPDDSYNAYVAAGWDKIGTNITLHKLSEKPE